MNVCKGKFKIAVVAVGGEGVRIGAKNNPKLLLKLAGRPFLEYVINLLLARFEMIYLLTGSYSRQIENFIRRTFPGRIGNSIRIVYGGKNGNAKAIASLSEQITEPFLYMDGNVICEPKGFESLVQKPVSAITMLVSPVSLVDTHLHVGIKLGKIIRMITIAKDEWQKRGMLCSLGVMTIHPKMFTFSPGLKKFIDLDLAIDFVYRNCPSMTVRPVVYNGWWCCIHTMRDMRFVRKYGQKLFKHITNSGVV